MAVFIYSIQNKLLMFKPRCDMVQYTIENNVYVQLRISDKFYSVVALGILFFASNDILI